MRCCILLGFAIIFVDFFTKEWVCREDAAHTASSSLPYVVFSDFLGIRLQITHAINTGAAWGVLADFPGSLVLIRILLISGLIVYMTTLNTRQNWKLPLTLIISGALGNVIDYFRYGYVVDMIQFRFWGYEYPVFNVADSAIFIGSFWILFSVMDEKKAA